VSDENVYRSRGLYLIVFLLAVTVMWVFIAGFQYLLESSAEYRFDVFQYDFILSLASIIILSVLTIVFYNIWMKIMYTLKDNGLLIESPVMPKEIEYTSIVLVEERTLWMTDPLYKGKRWNASECMQFAPAFFYDGIMITYGADEKIFISPVRKQEFLSKLETRLPSTSVCVRKNRQ